MANDPSYNEPPKKSNTLWWILGCGGLAILLGCGGFIALCGGATWFGLDQVAKIEQRVNDETGTAVTAEDLSKSPTTYNDKVVLVTGKVKSKPGTNMVELTGAPGNDPIICQTGLKKTDLFNSVSIGDTVTVKGLCAGQSPAVGATPAGISVTMCQTVTKK